MLKDRHHKLYGKLRDRGHSAQQATKIVAKLSHVSRFAEVPKPRCQKCGMEKCQCGPVKYAAKKDGELHKFSSTQINLTDPIKSKVLEAAAKITDVDLADDGRETEPHITVRYGLETDNADEIRGLLSSLNPAEFTLGDISLFEVPAKGYDVVKIEVESPDLQALNALLAKAPHTDTHPTYNPHVTLAYVKSGTGKKYLNVGDFKGMRGTARSIAFSDRLRNHKRISIGKTALNDAGLRAQIVAMQDDADPIGTVTLSDGFSLSVWKVDGDAVKIEHDMDFVEAGNGQRWPFIPKEEIWLDEELEPHDWRFNCLHECIEVHLMRGGMDYEKAHDIANAHEKTWRIECAMEALKAAECPECGKQGCEHVQATVAKYAKKKQDAAQQSMLGDDEQKHWITIGGHPGPDGKHSGGVHVEVSGGTIVKGPEKMIGKSPDDPEGAASGPGSDTIARGRKVKAAVEAGSTPQEAIASVGPRPTEEPFKLAPANAPPAKWIPANHGKQQQKTMLSMGGLPGQQDLFSTEGSEPQREAVAAVADMNPAAAMGQAAAMPNPTDAASTAPAQAGLQPTPEPIARDMEQKAAVAKQIASGKQLEESYQARKKDKGAGKAAIDKQQYQEAMAAATKTLAPYGVTQDEIEARVEELEAAYDDTRDYNRAFAKFQAESGMAPSKRARIANAKPPTEKDRVGLNRKDTHARGDVAVNIDDALISDWASRYPELGLREDSTQDDVLEILERGPMPLPSRADMVEQAASDIEDDLLASSPEYREDEINGELNTLESPPSPDELAEAHEALRQPDATGDTQERTPRSVLEEEGEAMEPERKPEAKAVGKGPRGFKTKQGSSYSWNGKTSKRNKSHHMGHAASDVGEKQESEATYFIGSEHAQEIGMWGSSSAKGKKLLVDKGHALLTSEHPVTGERGSDSKPIPLNTSPSKGAHPLELWGQHQHEGVESAFSGSHPGSEITEIDDDTQTESPKESAEPVESGGTDASNAYMAWQRAEGKGERDPSKLQGDVDYYRQLFKDTAAKGAAIGGFGPTPEKMAMYDAFAKEAGGSIEWKDDATFGKTGHFKGGKVSATSGKAEQSVESIDDRQKRLIEESAKARETKDEQKGGEARVTQPSGVQNRFFDNLRALHQAGIDPSGMSPDDAETEVGKLRAEMGAKKERKTGRRALSPEEVEQRHKQQLERGETRKQQQVAAHAAKEENRTAEIAKRKQMAAELRQSHGPRTKAALQKAQSHYEKADPELARAIGGWIESLADAASPFWDPRVANSAIRRRSVRSSKPGNHKAWNNR